MRQNSCATAMIILATILGPIVMIFLAVSFATDFWLQFTVDRTQLTTALQQAGSKAEARYTHTRNRGLFRECYPGTDTAFLQTFSTDVLDGYCYPVSYDVPENINFSDQYLSRIHLMRCHLAFLAVGIFCFLLAYIFGLVLCCWRKSRWAYIAGLCAYIAAFSTAAGIAFFHGAEYLERNKIMDAPLDVKEYFYQQWDSLVQNATSRKYGYSYALGWVGMILAAFTATFYSIAGCLISGESYEDRESLEKVRTKEYVERNGMYPMALEAPQPQPEYYYSYPRAPVQGYQGPVGQGYQGQYVYDVNDGRRGMQAYQVQGGGGGDPYWQWS